MSEHLHNIDDLFKKALDDHAEDPSPASWDEIDKKLDKNKVISISKKYYKLKWAAAVLLLFFFAMAMYTLHVRKERNQFVKNLPSTLPKKSESPSADNQLNQNENINAVSGSNKRTHEKNRLQTTLQPAAAGISGDTHVHHSSAQVAISAANQPITLQPFLQKNIMVKKRIHGNSYTIYEKNKERKVTAGAGILQNRYFANANYTVTSGSAKNSTVSQSNNTSISSKITDKIIDLSFEKNKNNIADIAVLTNSLEPIMVNTSAASLINDATTKPDKLNKKIFASKSITIHRARTSLVSADIFYSPDIVSAAVHNNNPRFVEEDKNEIKREEAIKYAATFGIKLNYGLGKRWMLASGISYSQKVSNIRPKTVYARPDNNGQFHYRINCDAGFSYVPVNGPSGAPRQGDSIQTQASQNMVNYIKVPLLLRYAFVNNKWNFIPSAGIELNLLTKGEIQTNVPVQGGGKTPHNTSIEGLKPTYYSGFVSMALQYSFSKYIALSFEPSSRFGLSSINKNAQVKTYYNSIGFAAGIVIKL